MLPSCVYRDPETQLELLDRLAGNGSAVAQFSGRLDELRSKQQQLAAIDALGSEEQRGELQALVDQVSIGQLIAGI